MPIDEAVKNMYILVMVKEIERSRLLLQTSVESPLGIVSIAGYIRNNRGVPFAPMRILGSYGLVYLFKGEGRMRSGGQPMVRCRAGDLLFLYPEIPHGYGPGPGESWDELFVVFNGPVFDLWRRVGLLNPRQSVLHLPRTETWLSRLEAVADPRLPDTSKGMTQRICRLQRFLGSLLKENPVSEPQAPWVEAASRRLLEIPARPHDAIARDLGLSYETFRKEFSRQTGFSPTRYRLVRLIEQARVLMIQQRMSNKQIAETLGFYDEFHFSRRFQQVEGKSTRSYRRQFLQAIKHDLP